MKTNRIGTRLVAAFVLVALVSGAPAVAGKYTVEEKTDRLAEPEEERATIYIVRRAKAGALIYFWSFADDQLVGVTRGPGYNWAYLEPGQYTIWSKAENVSAITLEVEAGKTYYIRQTALPGFGKARVRTELVSEQKWQDLMKKVKKISIPTEEGLEKARELAAKHLGLAREKAAKNEDD
ncbi:MAG: DUF2846 domain-containing protein [Acidobacteriota bacterium]|nr:DUF2846 domain-containing protein [Acidobacteriota bacterium]